MRIAATLVLVALATKTSAYPSYYINDASTTKCWVSPGEESPGGRMWTGPADGEATLAFTPSLVNGNTYIPGTSYTVTVSHSNVVGGTGIMGSTRGTWTTAGSGSSCRYNGYKSTTAVWTAPSSGAVTVGGSISDRQSVMKTVEMNLVAGAAPTTTMASTTSAATEPTSTTSSSSSTIQSTTPPESPYQYWQHSIAPHTNNDSVVPDGFQFDLKWNLTDTHFMMRIEAPTSGWIAFGIGEGGAGGMPGADIVACTAEGWVSDRYALAYATPLEDSKQDWTLLESGGHSGQTYCILKRARITDDWQDRQLHQQSLALGKLNILMAYGMDDSFTYHLRGNRATTQIDLFDDSTSIERLTAMPDYDTSVLLLNPNVSVPHDATSCNQLNTLVGGRFCLDAVTTYYTTTHSIAHLGDRSIIGLGAYIKNETRANVHHFVVSAYSSADCTDGYLGPTYIWAPGAQTLVYPEFLGVHIGSAESSASCLEIQTHYDNPDAVSGLVDSSGIVLHLNSPGQFRSVEAAVYQVGDPSVRLAGQQLLSGLSKYEFECGEANFAGAPNITIYGVAHHMHIAGKYMSTTLSRPGEPNVTWTTEFYDHGFQTVIPVNVTFNGAQLPKFSTECIFDSRQSTSYPFYEPTGRWGQGSDDEMCIDFFYYYPRVPEAISCELNLGSDTPPFPSQNGLTPLPNISSLDSVYADMTDSNNNTFPIPPVYCTYPSSDDTQNVHLVYCEWDGSAFKSHWVAWSAGLAHNGCSQSYPEGTPNFNHWIVDNNEIFPVIGYRLFCGAGNNPIGSHLVNSTLLSNYDALERLFGIDTGTYAPTTSVPTTGSPATSAPVSSPTTSPATSLPTNSPATSLPTNALPMSNAPSTSLPAITSSMTTVRSTTLSQSIDVNTGDSSGTESDDEDALMYVIIVVVAFVVVAVVAVLGYKEYKSQITTRVQLTNDDRATMNPTYEIDMNSNIGV